MNLSEIKMGESAIIAKVHGTGKFRRRIIEMGFVRGQKVEVLIGAPLKDPIKYKIMDYEVSLRRNEAEFIEVVSINEKETAIKSDNYGTIEYDPISIDKKKGNTINISRMDYSSLTLYLSNELLDISKPVIVKLRGKKVFKGRIKPSAEVYRNSLHLREDYRFATPYRIEVR